MSNNTISAAVAANRPVLARCFVEAKALIREMGLRPHHQALVLLAMAMLKSAPSAGAGLKEAMKEAIGVLKGATGAKLDALDTVAVVFLAGELAGMVAPTLSDVDADKVIQAIIDQNGPQITQDVHALGVDVVLDRFEQSIKNLSNGAAVPAGKLIDIRAYLEDRARWVKPPADADGTEAAPEVTDAPAAEAAADTQPADASDSDKAAGEPAPG